MDMHQKREQRRKDRESGEKQELQKSGINCEVGVNVRTTAIPYK